jgi:hypothetical protein
MNLKWAVLLLIIFGEALAIGAEMYASKSYGSGGTLKAILPKMFILIFFASTLLLLGYMFGYSHFKNIWIVSAVSITSILIIEPIIAFAVFREIPTKGALIGLIFGFLGFIFALFVK